MITIHINSNEEWTATKDLLKPLDIRIFPYGEYFETEIASKECIFYHSGATKTLSSGATQYAIDNWSPEIIFVLGTCGGVAEDIRPLDIIIVEQTAQYDVIPMKKRESIFHEIIILDNSWINLNQFPHKLLKGFIATADKSVTASNYHDLRDSDVTAADWETASIAKISEINGVKCCVIRGVSDVISEKDVVMQYEDYKRNTSIIMEILIKSYLPSLVTQYEDIGRHV